ncbi:MAG TPA: outer membrane lipoprotein-sorting protein [Verrucomicrobiae bacterium]|nr:outer membrane lipoprotein-sorting protein [Verrucomicrobiae bacterium]
MFALSVFAQKQIDTSQPTVLSPEQAAKEGKALADEILGQKPAQNTTNAGVMTIRTPAMRAQIPIQFEVFNTETNWCSRYNASNMTVVVLHDGARVNQYRLSKPDGKVRDFSGNQAIKTPFAGSDFSMGDLGLEFFHWPEQRLTKKEMKRSRSCKVLESTNPEPIAGTYSRVVSWIDNESDGIVMAQAYDAQGKLLKEFIPKKIKKVEGQWQLEEMEIDNVQANSSTRVDFDLSGPK